MKSHSLVILLQSCLLLWSCSVSRSQNIERRLGALREVFAWTQLTYDINGNMLLQDHFDEIEDNTTETAEVSRHKRHIDDDAVYFKPYNQGNDHARGNKRGRQRSRGNELTRNVSSVSTAPADEAGRFFIQYNNVPMGVERVGTRLFVTVPRRRYGIPSTLNYIDLTRGGKIRSPALRPYPSFRESKKLVSVYRTRDDGCGRLWMVDNGHLEIPNARRQVQPPAIVVFDLKTDRLLRRYDFKSTDIPSFNTPAGLASVTVDIINNDCDNAFAYVPDLSDYGIIVYSWKDNDSWRLTHNYVHFNPTAGDLNIAGQEFQWSDGIFSITLSAPDGAGCREAYFHPLASYQEFSVSTCTLKNRNATSDANYWKLYKILGERGANSQCTMSGYHVGTKVIFYADIGRDALSCWNAALPLTSTNVAILAQDSRRLSYPSDIHVTDDEVWVMSNSLPRFLYSRLDPTEYNFYIHKGSVQDLIANSACAQGLSLTSSIASLNNRL